MTNIKQLAKEESEKALSGLRLGFEIELEYNPDKVGHISKGNYHEPLRIPTSEYWRAERDSSLNAVKFSATAEITSKVLNNNNWHKAIKEFERIFSHNGKYELDEVIGFNSSCGAHIHFSIEGRETLHLKTFPQTYDELKKIAVKRLRLAGFSKEWIKTFTSHYYRSYAKENKNSTGHEYSLNTNTGKDTVEWRSFNLLGIDTWEDFKKAYSAAIMTISDYIRRMDKGGYKTAVLKTAQEQIEEQHKPSIKLSGLEYRPRNTGHIENTTRCIREDCNREIANNNRLNYCSTCQEELEEHFLGKTYQNSLGNRVYRVEEICNGTVLLSTIGIDTETPIYRGIFKTRYFQVGGRLEEIDELPSKVQTLLEEPRVQEQIKTHLKSQRRCF